MAPTKSLLSKIKVKPVKPLDLDEVLEEPETVVYGHCAEAVTLHPVTDAERAAWAVARALQTSLPNGQPTEGWGTRVTAMKADGRLVEHNGLWYRRD